MTVQICDRGTVLQVVLMLHSFRGSVLNPRYLRFPQGSLVFFILQKAYSLVDWYVLPYNWLVLIKWVFGSCTQCSYNMEANTSVYYWTIHSSNHSSSVWALFWSGYPEPILSLSVKQKYTQGDTPVHCRAWRTCIHDAHMFTHSFIPKENLEKPLHLPAYFWEKGF